MRPSPTLAMIFRIFPYCAAPASPLPWAMPYLRSKTLRITRPGRTQAAARFVKPLNSFSNRRAFGKQMIDKARA